jgi:hypothetical protein
MGHSIPGGTGFDEYMKRIVKSVDREGEEELQFVFND